MHTDGWIPVEERLPEEGKEVLAFNEKGERCLVYRQGAWKWDDGGLPMPYNEDYAKITHWAELHPVSAPEPPKPAIPAGVNAEEYAICEKRGHEALDDVETLLTSPPMQRYTCRWCGYRWTVRKVRKEEV